MLTWTKLTSPPSPLFPLLPCPCCQPRRGGHHHTTAAYDDDDSVDDEDIDDHASRVHPYKRPPKYHSPTTVLYTQSCALSRALRRSTSHRNGQQNITHSLNLSRPCNKHTRASGRSEEIRRHAESESIIRSGTHEKRRPSVYDLH